MRRPWMVCVFRREPPTPGRSQVATVQSAPRDERAIERFVRQLAHELLRLGRSLAIVGGAHVRRLHGPILPCASDRRDRGRVT